MKHILQSKATKLFLILGGFFVTNALVAEFIGVKIFQLESTLGFGLFEYKILGERVSLAYTTGVLIWPFVFVMTDVINEYFGKRGVQFLSYLTIALIIYAFMVATLAIYVAPEEGFWIGSKSKQFGVDNMQQAFTAVFNQGNWIIVGSLVAFLVGQIVDVTTFHRIKRFTGEKRVWLRATGSTLVSQLLDTFVVLYIAFVLGPQLQGGEAWSWAFFFAVAINNYVYKFVVAILLTPVIYAAHAWIDRFLGEELAQKMKALATS